MLHARRPSARSVSCCSLLWSCRRPMPGPCQGQRRHQQPAIGPRRSDSAPYSTQHRSSAQSEVAARPVGGQRYPRPKCPVASWPPRRPDNCSRRSPCWLRGLCCASVGRLSRRPGTGQELAREERASAPILQPRPVTVETPVEPTATKFVAERATTAARLPSVIVSVGLGRTPPTSSHHSAPPTAPWRSY